MSYNTKNYEAQGGDQWVVGSGGTLSIESGGTLDVQAGATVNLPSKGTEVSDVALAQGSVIVGDSDGKGSAVSAKTSGRILVGDGTTVASVAVSGDATLASTGAVTIANGAVTSGKLGAGAATLTKISFTGLKVLAAAGRNGAGAVTLVGAAITDRLVAVFGAPTAGGALAAKLPGTDFEAAVTVAGEIQQIAVGDLSTSTFLFILAPATA